MKVHNERGFTLVEVVILLVIIGLLSLFWIGVKFSNETVSGIVYNTTSDRFISGATKFSVRAAVDTYVTEENQSTYCLPSNSPYKELVNRAAQDKNIKIVVEEHKYFAIKAPWACYPNVTVKEVK